MSVWSFNGPANFLTVSEPLPNISGQNVTGYFYSYYFSPSVSFYSTGLSSRMASRYSYGREHWKLPSAMKKLYRSLPPMVRKKANISLVTR